MFLEMNPKLIEFLFNIIKAYEKKKRQKPLGIVISPVFCASMEKPFEEEIDEFTSGDQMHGIRIYFSTEVDTFLILEKGYL